MDKKLLLMIAAAFAFVGCNDDGGSSMTDEGGTVVAPVSIRPVMTKATSTNFESGDQIGLKITREAGVYTDNALLTYNGTAFTGTTMWYEEGGQESTLLAYYPYQSAGFPTSFTVASDQSTGVSPSDFIVGTVDNVLPTAAAVTVPFKHKLSRIIFDVTNNAGYTLNSMTLSGAIPTATLDTALTPTVDSTASAADITAYMVDDTTFEAIVIPQTVAFTVSVDAAGKVMTQRLLSAELLSGYSYTINLIVNPSDISVSISGDIVDWNDGGTIGEDTSVQFDEYDDHFVYDGVSYDIKTLADGRTWMVDNLRYIPDGKTVSSDPADQTTGIWYPIDPATKTAATDEATISSHGYLYSYAAALGSSITPENYNTFEGAQGICPTGWHIPTKAEFFSLVGYCVPSDTDTTAAYYDSDYNGGRIKTLDADGWNFVGVGAVNISTETATGKYLATITTSTTANDPYIGVLGLSYYMSSTGSNVRYSSTDPTVLTNIQFYGMMTTFTKSYMDGRLTVSNANYRSGYAVRCIKDE
jgi:uncharacterized protein (TIGR02145 family)